MSRYFLPYQVRWILDESRLCLAEKSVRIGWTYADAFKNVRKRLMHPRRDYLFTTKDEDTAIEYVKTCLRFCELFNLTRAVLSRDHVHLRDLPGMNCDRKGVIAEQKAGVIRFVNGSRILAFSSNPNALRAYGGDVGVDEFAFHPDAAALWASASGRVTWGYDLALWSSHNGGGTLFHRFAQEAAAGMGGWSYYRVTMADAVQAGLVEKINETSGARFTRDQFLADCKARARMPEVFEQEYMCNPGGDSAAIVPWATLSRCQTEDSIERIHLEEEDIAGLFGEHQADMATKREDHIRSYLRSQFAGTLDPYASCRLGFDVAASGSGDLAVFYMDHVRNETLQLAGLLTCRTQDWHFLKTALDVFLEGNRDIRGCGDETGLGRQICWEASQKYAGLFEAVNFSRLKQDLGCRLMSELAVACKRFPKAEPDIAADYFAIRKLYRSNRWTFSEGDNPLNPKSHCDIAWAGALASRAHATRVDARFVEI